jgi:hypothetical protein
MGQVLVANSHCLVVFEDGSHTLNCEECCLSNCNLNYLALDCTVHSNFHNRLIKGCSPDVLPSYSVH